MQNQVPNSFFGALIYRIRRLPIIWKIALASGPLVALCAVCSVCVWLVPTSSNQTRSTAVGAVTTTPTVTPTSAPVLAVEPSATTAPTTASQSIIGQDIDLGGVRWKFLDVQDVGNRIESNNQLVPNAVTSGKFIRVRFEVENLGKDQITYESFAVKDFEERTFQPIDDPLTLVPLGEKCPHTMSLDPNLPRTCQLIFEVAADATMITAEVDNFGGFFAKESAQVLLLP